MHTRTVHHFSAIMDWNSTILNHSSSDAGNAAHAQDEHDADADAPIKYNLVVAIILGIILSVLDLTTILGNLLVCVTILSRRSLRNTTNYFILSLSSSDLLLGIIVLPFSTINTLLKKWPLGWIFCNIFISFDVMLCTVSILNLFVISLERYYAVTSPMNYVKILTFRRVCWIIAGIWLFSFVMAFLPIMVGFNTPSQKVQNMYNPSECIFEANKVYVLLVAIFTYFTPLLIMCAVYVRIFLIARRQVERINTLVKSTIRMFDKSKAEKDPRFASDSKATVTLASVVTAFAICWIPYFVIFTARPFLPGPVDTHLDLFALWLGYVNSMLNPFLYAFHSTQFRRAFSGILLRRYNYNRTRTPYGQNV